MKRCAAFLFLVLTALPLAGCWSRVEINDLAVIGMMAVDLTDEGKLQLWVNVVVPTKAGGAPGTAGQSPGAPFITETATGRSIMEASRLIQLRLSRRLFWAHARVILIGENLARAGVEPVIDFLSRHRELRPTNYVLAIRGYPGELMGTEVNLERLPAEKIREISRARIGAAVQVGEWVEMLAEKGTQPVMAVVGVIPPPEGAPKGQNPSLGLVATALFQEARLVGFMDEHTTRGLLWLRGVPHRGVAAVTAEWDGTGSVSVEWTTTKTERRARLEGGRVVIEVQARVEGDISEETVPLDLSDPKVLKQIETELSREIRERMGAALDEMHALTVDAAGFGEVVHRQLPAVWKRLEKTWLTEGFQEAKVSLKADAKIRRTGLSSKPRGFNEEELIKGGR